MSVPCKFCGQETHQAGCDVLLTIQSNTEVFSAAFGAIKDPGKHSVAALMACLDSLKFRESSFKAIVSMYGVESFGGPVAYTGALEDYHTLQEGIEAVIAAKGAAGSKLFVEEPKIFLAPSGSPTTTAVHLLPSVATQKLGKGAKLDCHYIEGSGYRITLKSDGRQVSYHMSFRPSEIMGYVDCAPDGTVARMKIEVKPQAGLAFVVVADSFGSAFDNEGPKVMPVETSIVQVLLKIPGIKGSQVTATVDYVLSQDLYTIDIYREGEVTPAQDEVSEALKPLGLTLLHWSEDIPVDGGVGTVHAMYRYDPLFQAKEVEGPGAAIPKLGPHVNVDLTDLGQGLYAVGDRYYVVTGASCSAGWLKSRAHLTLRRVGPHIAGVYSLLELNDRVRLHNVQVGNTDYQLDYVIEDISPELSGIRRVTLRPFFAAPAETQKAWEAIRTTGAGGVLFLARNGKAILGIEPDGKIVVNPKIKVYAGLNLVEVGLEIAHEFWKAISDWKSVV